MPSLAVLAAATLSLSCDVAEVVPLLNTEGDERRQVSLVVRDGTAEVTGWPERLEGSDLAAAVADSGDWRIEGVVAGLDFPTRAIGSLTRKAGGEYDLEWGLAERRSSKPQWFYQATARGTCRETAALPAKGTAK